MRRALKFRDGRFASGQTATLPAPVGGRNARDALSAMPKTDAEILDNWFPEATDVRPRPGTNNHVGGLPGQIESIFSYANGNTLKLFAAVSGTFQDISGSATTASNTTATGMTGFTNDRWQGVNFGAGGTNVFIACNGADPPKRYDTSNGWQLQYFTSGCGTATSSEFIDVMEHKERLFFARKDKLEFWYMDNTLDFSGSIQSFPLNAMMPMGGYIMAMGTWTRDGGAGMDDLAVFISNRGEAAVFSGTDPGNSSAWSKVGVFRMPAPLSRRSLEKMGGDLLVLTEAGVLPFSVVLSGIEPQALLTDKANLFLTDKIRRAINDDVAVYRNNYGWEIKFFPAGHKLFVNVPVSTGSLQKQHVMNTDTKAWCTYGEFESRLEANCFAIHDNKIYYGGSTYVRRAEYGTSDYGADIQVDLKQAPTHFGYPGRLKKMNLMRPHVLSDGELPLAFGMNMDFNNDPPSSVPTPTAISWPEWDIATWDDYYWGDGPRPFSTRQTANGIGTYAQLRVKGNVNSETIRLIATDFAFQVGGQF